MHSRLHEFIVDYEAGLSNPSIAKLNDDRIQNFKWELSFLSTHFLRVYCFFEFISFAEHDPPLEKFGVFKENRHIIHP